jgi:hypothetical protein
MEITSSDLDQRPYLLADDYVDRWLMCLGIVRHVSEELLRKHHGFYRFLFALTPLSICTGRTVARCTGAE